MKTVLQNIRGTVFLTRACRWRGRIIKHALVITDSYYRQWRTEGIEQPNNIKVFVDRNSGAGGTHDYIGGHPGGGKQFLNGTEYESMIGATIALAAVAIAESVFRGIAAFVGLKCCKPGAGTKAAFVFGILMIALDATGVINTLISNAQSAPASMIALAMSGLYLFSVMKIRKENSSEN